MTYKTEKLLGILQGIVDDLDFDPPLFVDVDGKLLRIRSVYVEKRGIVLQSVDGEIKEEKSGTKEVWVGVEDSRPIEDNYYN